MPRLFSAVFFSRSSDQSATPMRFSKVFVIHFGSSAGSVFVRMIGSEREGLPQEILDRLDVVFEIPVYGLPASYNVVKATMAVCE